MEPDLLEAGATVGRYLILDVLGSGGMSVVYGAYDPQLDRRVALKLVRPGGDGRDSEHVRERLIREAQALARLAHPNVVTVHDVGTLGDQVFVAMEYVEGHTLTEWLTRRYSRARLLEVFVHAGEGLAAAHAVGLVHRDFKPDNVMIDGQGRVRVMDFGLARPSGSPSSEVIAVEHDRGRLTTTSGEAEASDVRPKSEPLGVPLTVTGAIMGTPAYMAPEQHAGGRTGPATDQFSFCVALYEALYGERPFGGDSRVALRANVTQGRMRPLPGTGRVSRRVRRAVLRGLAVHPIHRWSSMNALLDELRPSPRKRRRRGLLVAGSLVGMVGVAVVRWSPRSSSLVAAEACTAVAPLRGVWSDQRRASLEERFEGRGPAWVRPVWAMVRAGLDAQVADWTQTRAQVCEHEVTGDDPRVHCLERRRDELMALVGELEGDDLDGLRLQQVAEAVEGGAVAPGCAQPMSAADPQEPSGAPVVTLHRALAGVDARLLRRQVDDALARSAELRLDAEALGHGPLLAEAWLVRGRALAQAERGAEARVALEQAWQRAVAEGHDAVAIDAAIDLVQVLGRSGPLDGALRWARGAEAFIARGGHRSLRHARLKLAEAAVHAEAGEYDYARGLLHDAEDRRRRGLGEGAPGVVEVRVAQGALEQDAGQLDQALEHYRRARAQLEQSLGPDHPWVAELELRLADVWIGLGMDDSARQALERSQARARRAHAGSPPAMARALIALADRLGVLGASDPAHAAYDEAEQIVRVALGEGHPLRGLVQHHRARTLLRQQRWPEAERELRAALAGLEGSLGSGHATVAAVLDDLGQALQRQGQPERALEQHRRAEAIWRSASRMQLARSLILSARAGLEAGRSLLALVRLEQAQALLDERSPVPELEAEARILRARALAAQGGEPAEISSERRAAAALLAGDRHVDPTLREELEGSEPEPESAG